MTEYRADFAEWLETYKKRRLQEFVAFVTSLIVLVLVLSPGLRAINFF